MRSPALRQRFSSPAVSRTATPSQSRSASYNSLEALEEGHFGAVDEEDEHDVEMGGFEYYSEEEEIAYPLQSATCVPFSFAPKPPPPRIQRPSRAFVPDIQYKDYLFGNATSKRQRRGCCDGQSCARGCAFFSLVAVMFLLFVAILIDTQPLYIQGVQLEQYDDSNNLYKGGRLPAASNAYASAGAYFITMLVSIAFLHSPYNIWMFVKSRIRRRHYRDIPDAIADWDSVIPVFHATESRLEPTATAYGRPPPAPRSLELWNYVGRKLWKPAPKTKRR